MAVAPESLLEQALTLPPADRAMLASGLLDSLDADRVDAADVELYWSNETERRAAQLGTGGAELTTWQHLIERVQSQQSSSRTE